jgi:hypothetical protein
VGTYVTESAGSVIVRFVPCIHWQGTSCYILPGPGHIFARTSLADRLVGRASVWCCSDRIVSIGARDLNQVFVLTAMRSEGTIGQSLKGVAIKDLNLTLQGTV